MATDWIQMSNASDFRVDASTVDVSLRDGRQHRVEVIDQESRIVLRAFVVKQAVSSTATRLAF